MKKIRINHDDHLNKDVYKLWYEPDETPAMQLFNSDDVIKGNPSSSIAIGFIYTWKDDKPPEKIRKFFQRVSNYAFITGLWKTTNGTRYVFANILSNPNVNKLILFVFGQKDNGHLLVNALTNFWKNGTDKNGIIIGSKAPNPKFEQVTATAADRIRKQADLLVYRNITDLDKAEKIIMSNFQEPENATPAPECVEFISNVKKDNLLYDDGARFFDIMDLDLSNGAQPIKTTKQSGDSSLGASVQADSIEAAVNIISEFISGHGTKLTDQRGTKTIESRSFSVAIKDPLSSIPKDYSKEYLEKYCDEFLNGTDNNFAYTYHDRIFKKWGNQVTKAVRLLKSNPDTRRCLISLWDPLHDLENKNPPCLNFIWFVIRDHKLEMHVVFRSHHIATVTKDDKIMQGEGAFVPNIYALANLQKNIAKKLDTNPGYLILTDFSAHLYQAQIHS